MKSIYNLYEVSITSNKLDESSILGDVEDAMKSGDDLIDTAMQEFEKIMSTVSQHKLWDKRTLSYYKGNRTVYVLNFWLKNISKAYDLKPNDLLRINVIKNNESGNWEICLLLNSNNGPVKDYKSIRNEISQNQVKNFPALIKLYVLPYFKDINTFIKLFK